MQKPMVPFDGSRSALRVLEHALAELHGRADAQVHVLNVRLSLIHI